jgi:hypothetical protein
VAILFSNQLASRGSTPDLAAELSRDPVVLKGEFLGRLGYASPVVGQILTRPNPYRDALLKAKLYKESEFSMPTGTEALGLSNYGDASYYLRDFGRYT